MTICHFKKGRDDMWKDIPNYDGYQVSDDGRVRTHNKTTRTERHGVRHWADRELVPKKRNDGVRGGDYRVDLWKDGKPKCYKISRLVAFTFYGEDLDNSELTVNHIDGDWKNNTLANLELVSRKENIQHAFRTGLMPTKRTTVTDKATGEKKTYMSMCEASRAIGKNNAYISRCVKACKFENATHSWAV
jgi:hypothetical protein